MHVGGAAADLARFDQPAEWPWTATAVAIVLYGAPAWIVGPLIGAGALPDGTITLWFVLLARTALVVLWLRRVAPRRENGSWASAYGLVLRPVDVLLGLAAALATYYVEVWILYVGVLWLGPTAEVSAWQQVADSIGRLAFVGVALFGICTAPLIEEVVFRGMLLRTLARSNGSSSATVRVLVASTIFAAAHLTPALSWQANLVTFLAIGVFGASMCLLARSTNRLGPGLVAHTLTLLVSFVVIAGRVP